MRSADFFWHAWCERIEQLEAALAVLEDAPVTTRLDLYEQIDTLHWFRFMYEPDEAPGY